MNDCRAHLLSLLSQRRVLKIPASLYILYYIVFGVLGQLKQFNEFKVRFKKFNPLECEANYSATLKNMELVHWPLMGGLLHLVQQRGDWAGPQQPA